jgi:hypothetical protein
MIRQTVTVLTQPAACAPSIRWLVHPQLTPGSRGLIAVEVLRDGETRRWQSGPGRLQLV